MRKRELKISFPIDWVSESDKKAFAMRMKTLYVLDKVRRKEISAIKGADMLGMHLTEFAPLMKEFGIPYFTEPPRDPEELVKLYQKAKEDKDDSRL